MPVSRSVATLVCALCLTLSGCDEAKKSDDAPKADADAAAEEAGKKTAENIKAQAEEEAGKDDDDEDKGTAKLVIGEDDWSAERATARLRNGNLTISASKTDMADGKVARQELRFTVKDFGGPGSYQTGMGSMFVGVGFDLDKAKEAEGDDAKTQEMAVDTIKGAETIMIMNGKVEITEATDEHIDGTIEYAPPAQTKQPGIKGSFHAVIKK